MSDNTEYTEVEFEVTDIRAEETSKGRRISGYAVPYNEDSVGVKGMTERFLPGAFEGARVGTPLYWNHEYRKADGTDDRGVPPIGSIVELRDEEKGLWIEAEVSSHPKADAVYTLVQEGHIKGFSVGFNAIKTSKSGTAVIREKAFLTEVSVVPFGAYKNAAIALVRAADNSTNEKEVIQLNNIENPAVEVAEIRSEVSELAQKVAVLSNGGNNVTQSARFNSVAEATQAAFLGKTEEVASEIRAWTGGVSLEDNDGATQPQWVRDTLRLVDAKRPIHNLFKKAPLPANGLDYRYPVITGTTGQAGVQVNEGDDLNLVTVSTGFKAGTIETLGVATTISRQAIERSDPSLLQLTLEQMYNEYAALTERRALAALVGATGTGTGFLVGGLAAAKALDYEDAIDDAAADIESDSRGLAGEVVLMSRDVFRTMRRLTANDGRPVFEINGDGSNTVGTLGRSRGTIAGLPVIVVNTLAAGSFYVVSTEAIRVREDALRSLQEENVINLTKDYSIYGYHSVDTANTLGIVKVDTDGTA